MERFLCLVLPNWSTDRVRRRLVRALRAVDTRAAETHAATRRAPTIVLTARARGGGAAPVVARVCERARAAGVEPGATLALARGLLLHEPLHVEAHDPEGDAAALLALARAAQRFTPRAAVATTTPLPRATRGSTTVARASATRSNTARPAASTPDAIVLEIGGSLRLFGGERTLALAALDWLTRHGVAAYAGVASTVGAAHALAHALALAPTSTRSHRAAAHGKQAAHASHAVHAAQPARGRGAHGVRADARAAGAIMAPLARAAPGAERAALAPLPLAVLRLSEELLEALHELGLATVGDALALPRHEVPARLGDELLVRLDQALGRAPEGLARVAPPLEFERTREFAGALESRVVLALVVRELVDDLVVALARQEHVCARLELRLWPSDAAQDAPPLALVRHASRAGCDARLLWALFEHELEHAPIGFGVERVQLLAGDTARARESQHALLADGDAAAHARASAHASDLAALVDVLRGRLGPGAAFAANLCADVRSECSATPRALSARCTTDAVPSRPRPTRLFEPPRPIEVLAVDGRPRVFADGGRRFELVHVDGPERLVLPWWPSAPKSRAAAAPALLARRGTQALDFDALALGSATASRAEAAAALAPAATALRHQRDLFRARDDHGRLVWLVRALVVADVNARAEAFDLDARLVELDRGGPSQRVQAHDVAFAWYLHGEWC